MLLLLIFYRYFLRKLKKVKKSNGQVLAINEVSIVCALSDCHGSMSCFLVHLMFTAIDILCLISSLVRFFSLLNYFLIVIT